MIRYFVLNCFYLTLLPCLNLCCIQAKTKKSNSAGKKEAENSARSDTLHPPFHCILTKKDVAHVFSPMCDAQAKEEESNEAKRDHLEDLPLPS